MVKLHLFQKRHKGSGRFLAHLVLLAAPLSCTSVTAPLVTSWEGSLVAIRPHFVGGRAAAVTQFQRTAASLAMEDGEPEVTYGWRVNAGTCSEEGEIQGGVAAYPPLVTSAVGSAQAEATLAAEFKHGRRFAVRVFLPVAGGSEEVVACGELQQVQ